MRIHICPDREEKELLGKDVPPRWRVHFSSKKYHFAIALTPQAKFVRTTPTGWDTVWTSHGRM